MKKIIVSLLAVTFASTMVSCLKDAENTGVLGEERRQELIEDNPDQILSSALAGMSANIQSACYSNLSHNYFGQKSFDYLTSLMGNDMVMTGAFAMSYYHYLLDYWQQEYTCTYNRWDEYYTHIADANNILRAIDPDTDDPAVLYYRATALAFRGYAYFQLTSLYQHAYYTGADGTVWGKGAHYDWSEALCVPIVTEDTDGDQPRSTVKEVYAQMIGDLEEAYEIFSEIGRIHTADPTDFDGTVVAMYLARANMVRHNWADALKYAQVVIDNYPILTSRDDILYGFSSLSLPDVVFGCDVTNDNTTVYMSWFSQMDMFGDGYAAIGVWRAGNKDLVDQIKDDDVRLDWFWTSRNLSKLASEFGMMGAYVYYQSCKFIGGGRPNTIVDTDNDCLYCPNWELGDYIYLRSEEAYLMKAEILAHQNNLAGAADALEQFMKTRCPSYSCDAVKGNKAKLIEEIILQKRIEFWGEGLEWLDNRRLNIPVDRTSATNNHLAAAKDYWDQEEPPFAYQIPLREIENNKMISPEDQNPDYGL